MRLAGQRRAARKPVKPVKLVEFGRAMGPGWVQVTLPVIVVSEANQREHWTKKHRRASAQKGAVLFAMPARDWLDADRYHVAFTRLFTGSRPLDSDNLAGAFKHVRDAVARRLGIDDGSSRLTWDYAQERGKANGIRIRIEAR